MQWNNSSSLPNIRYYHGCDRQVQHILKVFDAMRSSCFVIIGDILSGPSAFELFEFLTAFLTSSESRGIDVMCALFESSSYFLELLVKLYIFLLSETDIRC